MPEHDRHDRREEISTGEPPPQHKQPDLPPEEVHLEDGRIEHPRVSYVPDTTPFGKVLAVMIAALVLGALHLGGAWWFFRDRERSQAAAKASPLAVSLHPVDRLPAAPRLEQLDRLAGVERADEFRQQKIDEAELDRYGSTKEEGFIRVPIDRAMDYLAGRMPARKSRDSGPVRDQGLLNAGDSNSGRLFRGRQ